MKLTLTALLVAAAMVAGNARAAERPSQDRMYAENPLDALGERAIDRLLNLWDLITGLIDDVGSAVAVYNPLGGVYGPATVEDRRREAAFHAIIRAAGYVEMEQLVGYGAYPERQILYGVARQPSDADLEAVERSIRRFKQRFHGPIAWVHGVILGVLLDIARYTDEYMVDTVLVTVLPLPHVEVVMRGDGSPDARRRRRSLNDSPED